MDGDMPDDHTEQLKLVEAFKHGQQAKADGHSRRALPAEYRRDGQRTRGPRLDRRLGRRGDAGIQHRR